MHHVWSIIRHRTDAATPQSREPDSFTFQFAAFSLSWRESTSEKYLLGARGGRTLATMPDERMNLDRRTEMKTQEVQVGDYKLRYAAQNL